MSFIIHNKTIIIIIAALLILILYTMVLIKSNYTCPNCHKDFKPKLTQLLFTTHLGSSYEIKCPYCGKSSMMKPSKNKNE